MSVQTTDGRRTKVNDSTFNKPIRVAGKFPLGIYSDKGHMDFNPIKIDILIRLGLPKYTEDHVVCSHVRLDVALRSSEGRPESESRHTIVESLSISEHLGLFLVPGL